MNSNTAAANTVEQQARLIADNACEHLLSAHADMLGRFGETANQLWTDHLQQRIIELAAALATGDHDLFASRLAWSRSAMKARGLSPDDLDASLVALRTGLQECLDGAELASALECIDSAIDSLQAGTVDAQNPTLDSGLSYDRLALQYVQTVVAGNIFPAMQLVLDAVAHGAPIADAYLKILLPAQREVGRLWHLNELSVSEEHLVSYTTQRLMAVLATRMPRKRDNGFTAICGSVSNNVHDIGIRAITYLLEFEGWRTIYLGSDIPRVELPATIVSYQADILLLSIALSSQIPATKRSIAEIREKCAHPVKIMVGGNGLSESPELWHELGADAYAATAMEALNNAHRLASGKR